MKAFASHPLRALSLLSHARGYHVSQTSRSGSLCTFWANISWPNLAPAALKFHLVPSSIRAESWLTERRRCDFQAQMAFLACFTLKRRSSFSTHDRFSVCAARPTSIWSKVSDRRSQRSHASLWSCSQTDWYAGSLGSLKANGLQWSGTDELLDTCTCEFKPQNIRIFSAGGISISTITFSTAIRGVIWQISNFWKIESVANNSSLCISLFHCVKASVPQSHPSIRNKVREIRYLRFFLIRPSFFLSSEQPDGLG